MQRPPDQPPPIPPPMPLPMPPPLPRPRPPGTFTLRMMLGFFGYLLVSAGWAWLAMRLRLRGEVMWGVWTVTTGGLLALALYLRVRYGFSGFGYGILTALLVGMLLVVGLVILLMGMCFKAMSNH